MKAALFLAAFAALSQFVTLPAHASGSDKSVASAPLIETIKRSDSFSYRIERPENPSGQTIVLLHGSGGNENSLMKMAGTIAPRATLIGIRGRVVQDGRNRWYRRITPVAFDQADIRAESEAFVTFLKRTASEQKLDLGRTIFLGYSNGANLIAATALLHPGLVKRAALLRPMSVLDEPPVAALAGASVLVVAGKSDATYGPYAPALEMLLRSCGATVDAETIASGHQIGDKDAELVGKWLATTVTTASLK